MLVMDPGLTAVLAVGLASYVGYVFKLSPGLVKIVAIAAILTVAFVNIRGVKLAGSLVRWLTILKLSLLAFVILWSFGTQAGQWSNFTPLIAQRPGSEPLLGALAAATVGAFFSFGGWWDLSKVAGEVRDPQRTLPRALILGVAILTAVYILTSAAFFYLVPLEQVTTGEIFVAQAGEVMFGRAGGLILSAIVIVTVFGSIAAIVMSAPRVYFAMARDGLFVPAVAQLHPRFETPARAISIQALLASVLVLLGSFDTLISYFVFVVVIFIGLTVATLFVLRRRNSNAHHSYKTPGYPVTPIVFLCFTALILFLIGGNRPKEAFYGVGVVLLGLPVYYLLMRSRSDSTQRKTVSTETR